MNLFRRMLWPALWPSILLQELRRMSAQLEALNTEVARTAALTAQVVTELKGEKIDPAAVQAAADALKASNDTLAAAVTPAG